MAALDKGEPASHALYFRYSRVVARLAGRNRVVLQHARTLLERAMGMLPNTAEYLNELGYQLMLGETVRARPCSAAAAAVCVSLSLSLPLSLSLSLSL